MELQKEQERKGLRSTAGAPICLDIILGLHERSSVAPPLGKYLLNLSLAHINYENQKNDSGKGEQHFIPNGSILGQVCSQSHRLGVQFSRETSWSCLSLLSERLQGQRAAF